MTLLLACSADEGSAPSRPAFQDGAEPGSSVGTEPGSVSGTNAAPGAGGARATGAAATTGIDDYDRPLGMPIGRGASGDDEAPGADTPLDPGQTPAASDGDEELVIPAFEAADVTPPCAGCVELQIRVNDINQRDDFVFDAGGMAGVTSVVWTIVVPFNSDQLFVQPFVDDAYGTYTDLDANAFAIDTPIELVHTLPAAANAGSIGLAIGSAGAWTGDMVMSLFVDAVTIEANGTSTSRSFDLDVEGMATRTNAHQPQVIHHP